MYLSKLTIRNFRCFGDSDKPFELPLKPGLTYQEKTWMG